MKNRPTNGRSGASQASTINPATSGDDYSEGGSRAGRNRTTAPGGAKPDSEPVTHTAGGTTSGQPRQIDRQ